VTSKNSNDFHCGAVLVDSQRQHFHSGELVSTRRGRPYRDGHLDASGKRLGLGRMDAPRPRDDDGGTWDLGSLELA
jgi:hypothetical protein